MTERTSNKKTTSKLFTPDGKPLRVLSTSLGVALLANAIFSTGVAATGNATSADPPKLVSWSTDEVKAYFDKNVDWSLPLPIEEEEETSSDGAGTTVVNHYNSGFGWDDLLLYHLLFNTGSSYSSSRYYNNRPAHYSSTSKSYKPKMYTSDMFQNKYVAGSSVMPKTSTSTGSVTKRTTSSKPGAIGGKSSGLSSSSSSSSKSSRSSGGFGG
ncbi:hypothetical protein [Paenibacillus sp. L3-i20]|uniref:hypothetical protein n=1 Tax=Paenibacillus sp. L3-i20 TaxID=2905833 RepID=UPI001EDE6598|nr:hypothetical protein [Paenibacillus sp. L3-i20]GKU76287.1 hypothetical protein L3i20_v206840 [Paenibacillus sp. L3-i20]